MHFIRLMRPPSVAIWKSTVSLSLVLTINTDLSDSFLCSENPVRLATVLEIGVDGGEREESVGGEGRESVLGESEKKGCDPLEGTKDRNVNRRRSFYELSMSDGKGPAVWRPGMRILKAHVPLPQDLGVLLAKGVEAARLLVAAADPQLSAHKSRHILASSTGLIMPLWVDLPTSGHEATQVVLRRLQVSTPDYEAWIEVEEELGESMARHVWDAGVIVIPMLAELCGNSTVAGLARSMPVTKSVLTQTESLRIIELGTGVGVFGIGLATVLQSSTRERRLDASILLTDLPDAEERALANISRFQKCTARQSAHVNIQLEYENLDWEDGRKAALTQKVKSIPWDLVILCDCTYNTDTMPALVQTLSALHASSVKCAEPKTNTGLRVLLATKPRHSSEKAAFRLLSSDNWKIKEKAVLPLPVLAAQSQRVEVYLFEKD